MDVDIGVMGSIGGPRSRMSQGLGWVVGQMVVQPTRRSWEGGREGIMCFKCVQCLWTSKWWCRWRRQSGAEERPRLEIKRLSESEPLHIDASDMEHFVKKQFIKRGFQISLSTWLKGTRGRRMPRIWSGRPPRLAERSPWGEVEGVMGKHSGPCSSAAFQSRNSSGPNPLILETSFSKYSAQSFPLQPPSPSYHYHLLTLVTGAESSFEPSSVTFSFIGTERGWAGAIGHRYCHLLARWEQGKGAQGDCGF